MSSGRGRGRGRGRGGGTQSATHELVQRASSELGLSVFGSVKVEEPPPRYPQIRIPPFDWHSTDAFTVEKLRDIDSFMRASPYYLQRKDQKSDICRYSDRIRDAHEAAAQGSSVELYSQSQNGDPSALMHDRLMRSVASKRFSPLFTQELFTQPQTKLTKRARSYSTSSLNSQKQRRTSVEGNENGDAGNDDEDKESQDAMEEEEAADEDFNDYAINYYESDEDNGDGDGGDEPEM